MRENIELVEPPRSDWRTRTEIRALLSLISLTALLLDNKPSDHAPEVDAAPR